jgi:hypothetical protein
MTAAFTRGTDTVSTGGKSTIDAGLSPTGD